MPNAMPDAYAFALPGALPTPQCTDGRTDGQDVEPPSIGDLLELCDACETSGHQRTGLVGERTELPDTGAAACRAGLRGVS